MSVPSAHAVSTCESPARLVLETLHASATVPAMLAGRYAGDISPIDAWNYIKAHKAVVVDVRTLPEWQFTGTPNVQGTAGELALLSWKHYPNFNTNMQFCEEFQRLNIAEDTPVFFLCKVGGRSLDAALAITQNGYDHCFNIAGGFEGEPDEQGRRGTKSGWKASGLPWQQG